jgi:hypothetical protein
MDWAPRKFICGDEITNADQRRALLLHYAGEKVYDIYDVEKKDSAATYDATKKVLGDYFAHKRTFKLKFTTLDHTSN